METRRDGIAWLIANEKPHGLLKGADRRHDFDSKYLKPLQDRFRLTDY